MNRIGRRSILAMLLIATIVAIWTVFGRYGCKGWQRRFDVPIETPDGTRLNTLREAIAYLAKIVPKSERNMPAVTTAAEMLTYAAERDWPTNQARIGVMKALHRHEVRQFNPDAKDHHWGKRKLKRDQ